MSDYHYINEKAGSETYHQERLEVFDPLDPHQICPKRSPEAVSEAIKDIIKDKVVCELGCAEGDNMVFMAKYAKKVVGLEYDPNRYNVAVKRGLDVVMEDYFDENYSLPQADVHYVWPVDTIPDNARVIKKILLDERLKGKMYRLFYSLLQTPPNKMCVYLHTDKLRHLRCDHTYIQRSLFAALFCVHRRL